MGEVTFQLRKMSQQQAGRHWCAYHDDGHICMERATYYLVMKRRGAGESRWRRCGKHAQIEALDHRIPFPLEAPRG